MYSSDRLVRYHTVTGVDRQSYVMDTYTYNKARAGLSI
jgi:hypothetical protein